MKTDIYKTSGPDRDGCSDLPEIDLEKWFSLGGDDIAVWNTDWTVKTKPGCVAAWEYIRDLYDLDDVPAN
jgi:hypothetical protein